jgi:hypothetical protein
MHAGLETIVVLPFLASMYVQHLAGMAAGKDALKKGLKALRVQDWRIKHR